MVELLIIIYNNGVMTLHFSMETTKQEVSLPGERTRQLGFLSSEKNWSKVMLLSRKYTPEPRHCHAEWSMRMISMAPRHTDKSAVMCALQIHLASMS